MLVIFVLSQVASAKKVEFAIHITKQSNTLTLMRGDEVILTGPISMGKEKTPTGLYRVGAKEPHTFSHQLLEQTGHKFPMSHCLRLEGLDDDAQKKGVCIHQGNTEGISHGCIRCPRWLALKLFQIVPVGTEVLVTWADTEFTTHNHPKGEIWVKKGVWKETPTSAISHLMRPLNNGVNQGGISPDYPMDLNALALILGRPALDDSMFVKGGQLEGTNEAIVRYLPTVPKGETATIRYTNPETGAEGFLFDGGDYFLWWPMEQVSAFIGEVNKHQRSRGPINGFVRTLKQVPSKK